MKHFVLFLFAVAFSSCSVVSRQTYYVPTGAHSTIKNRSGYFKMIRSQVKIPDSKGDSIGSISTSNGIGNAILMGPPFLPVIPIGLADVFYKRNHLFVLDMSVRCKTGDFMSMAIDSSNYKKTRDSVNKLKVSTSARLGTDKCYIMVNGSKRVPLRVEELFMGSTTIHNYHMSANLRFKNIKTMQLVTGNSLIDSALKNVTFTRKHRITHCVLGPS